MTRATSTSPNLDILKQWPVSSWDWPKIAVFIPILPALPYADEVMPHFLEIARTGVDFIYHPFTSIDSVRNRVVEGARLAEKKFTHLLMLDGDQKHQHDIVHHMARRVLEDPTRRVIGGLYYNRRPPFLPLAWVRGDDGFLYQAEEWEQGILGGLDIVAAGCLFIDLTVFDEIERPWFYHSYDGVKEQKAEYVYPTEDIGFCKKVREAGIEIYLDTTVKSPHARTGWVDEQTYRSYKEANDELRRQEVKLEEIKNSP